MVADDNVENIRVLTSVGKGVGEARRMLQELQPELSTSVSDVVNAARQQLCTSLIRRLEIAEKELKDLREMLELNLKA